MSCEDYDRLLTLCGVVAAHSTPLGRAEAFFRGYLSLCEADFLAVLSASPAEEFFSVQGGLMLGTEDGFARRLQEWYFAGAKDSEDPFNRALFQRGGQTGCRHDLIPDRDWYEHPHVAEGWRWVGLDDALGNAVTTPHGTVLLAAMRPWSARPFGPRERQLHHCLSIHFGWLFRELQTAGHLGPKPDGLPRHLDAVLQRLLRGHAEKEIARALDLSPRTINKYVEKILRFYGVSSRAELMARWISLDAVEPPPALQVISTR